MSSLTIEDWKMLLEAVRGLGLRIASVDMESDQFTVEVPSLERPTHRLWPDERPGPT